MKTKSGRSRIGEFFRTLRLKASGWELLIARDLQTPPNQHLFQIDDLEKVDAHGDVYLQVLLRNDNPYPITVRFGLPMQGYSMVEYHLQAGQILEEKPVVKPIKNTSEKLLDYQLPVRTTDDCYLEVWAL